MRQKKMTKWKKKLKIKIKRHKNCLSQRFYSLKIFSPFIKQYYRVAWIVEKIEKMKIQNLQR